MLTTIDLQDNVAQIATDPMNLRESSRDYAGVTVQDSITIQQLSTNQSAEY